MAVVVGFVVPHSIIPVMVSYWQGVYKHEFGCPGKQQRKRVLAPEYHRDVLNISRRRTLCVYSLLRYCASTKPSRDMKHGISTCIETSCILLPPRKGDSTVLHGLSLFAGRGGLFLRYSRDITMTSN